MSPKMIVTLMIFSLVTAAKVQAADAYWPGWLGPKRDGWVANFQPPVKWPAKLNKRWQKEVGTGYGSPLVEVGRVFQHARQDEDEVTWCFDLKTGAKKWVSKYPVPFKIGGGGEYHGKGPKSCPVLADGRLFTMSISGVLTARATKTGDFHWARKYESGLKKGRPYWGASTSPIVDGNHVIAHFGTDNKGALVALDVQSGEEVWSLGDEGPSYSSPLVVNIEGVRQVVEWNHDSLVGVDRKSGKRLWSHPFPHVGSDQNMPTPSIYNGVVLLGAENRGLHAFQPKLIDGAWKVNKLWSQKKIALDMSSAVINDGLLYGMSHYGRGRIFCVDPKTGKILWQGLGRTGNNVTFLSIPGHVLALINNGQLHVLKANSKQYEKLASYQVAESATWAPPVLLPSGLLVKDTKSLTCWEFPRD